MRLWVISDLHLSKIAAQSGWQPPVVDADVAVVAGDICEGVGFALNWLWLTIAKRLPVLWVAGNHEFYGEELPGARTLARTYADRVPGLHLLDDSSVVVGGVRFLGATLWTDYRIQSHGERAGQIEAMRTAAARISDHRQIWIEPSRPGYVGRHMSPADALAMHETSVAWLDAEMAKPFDGPTVVVSHHAPHPMSVAARWREDASTPAFVSDLSSLIDRGQPRLWVHGHVHQSFDYAIKHWDALWDTRVICNPRGYGDGENPSFDWGLVVEV